jgi:hypothetical protein
MWLLTIGRMYSLLETIIRIFRNISVSSPTHPLGVPTAFSIHFLFHHACYISRHNFPFPLMIIHSISDERAKILGGPQGLCGHRGRREITLPLLGIEPMPRDWSRYWLRGFTWIMWPPERHCSCCMWLQPASLPCFCDIKGTNTPLPQARKSPQWNDRIVVNKGMRGLELQGK